MSGISSTGVSGTGSIYPTLAADPTHRGPTLTLANSRVFQRMEGFVGDGDYFVLPVNSTGTIDYFDSAGVQITTGSWASGFTLIEINAAVDFWVGFMFDKTAALLYVVGIDTNPANPAFYLASINVSGVIVNIGNATPTTDFSVDPAWASASASGASSIYRTADGSGNIFVRANGSTALEEMEMNISSGAIVTDTAEVATRTCHYKTAAGIYVGGFSGRRVFSTSGDMAVAFTLSGANTMAIATPSYESGFPYGNGSDAGSRLPLQWAGRVEFAGLSGTCAGVKAATVANFEASIATTATALGVS